MKKEHGLFGKLIAEALNVPSEQVDEALDKMRENLLNGWHPASEPPQDDEDDIEVLAICDGKIFERIPMYATYCKTSNRWSHADVKWWCYPPKE